MPIGTAGVLALAIGAPVLAQTLLVDPSFETNPLMSYTTVLGSLALGGTPSLSVREHPEGV